jgi:hypothetical protein
MLESYVEAIASYTLHLNPPPGFSLDQTARGAPERANKTSQEGFGGEAADGLEVTRAGRRSKSKGLRERDREAGETGYLKPRNPLRRNPESDPECQTKLPIGTVEIVNPAGPDCKARGAILR